MPLHGDTEGWVNVVVVEVGVDVREGKEAQKEGGQGVERGRRGQERKGGF